MHVGVHLTHCGFGEHFQCCKYGDDNCPALRPDSAASKVAAVLKGQWMREVAAGATEDSFAAWADDNGHKEWRQMLAAIYDDLDAKA